MPSVRNALHQIAHFLLHAVRQGDSEILLQHKGDAALSGLAVDADHVRFVLPSHILRVNGKIGNLPALPALSFLSPCHPLGDGVLMGAGKGGEHQVSRIRRAFVYVHAGQPFIDLPDLHDMREIQPRIHPVADHVQRQGDDVHISGPLPVSEKRALHPVRARQHAELRVADAAAPVVVGMDAQDHRIPVFHMFVQILHLTGEHMGHGHLYRGWNIDDGFLFRRRLPDIQHRVAHLQRVVHLRSRKTLRTVLKGEIPFGFLRQTLQKLRPVHGKPLHFLPALVKHLLPLGHGGGIVQMHHRMGRSLHRLKGLSDDMLPGLGQHLDGHILRDHLPLDQLPKKPVLRIGGRREADLDLLKSHLHEHLKKFQLLLQAHGLDQRLISVPQIHAAPDGRLLYGVLFRPVKGYLRRHKIRSSVFFTDFCIHGFLSRFVLVILAHPAKRKQGAHLIKYIDLFYPLYPPPIKNVLHF